MSYRFDNRDEKTFSENIKSASITEAKIVLRLATFIFNKVKKWPKITPVGTGYDGELTKKAVVSEDYLINSVPVDITHANTFCARYFHEKTNKADKSANGDFNIVFVNGFGTDKPVFVFIKPPQMKELIKKSIEKYGIVRMPGKGSDITQKKAYRFNIDWLDKWEVLPPISKDYPKNYDYLLELINEKQEK